MPLIKCNSHPAPGYHADGSLVVVENKSVGTAQGQRRKIVQGNLNFGNSGFGTGTGVGAGGGSTGGGGFDSTFNPFGTGQSGATIDHYNPIRDRLDEGSVVEDWIPRDAAGLDQMFLLMYHRDHIAGTIVDILADMIWSEFDIPNIQDPVIRNIYMDSMSAIDIVATLPDITREYLVLGRTISSMIFDKTRGIFKDLVSHDPSFVRLTPIPIKGFDPKIDLIPSPAMRAFIESEDPRDVDARKILPESYIEAIRKASGSGAGIGSGAGSGFGMGGGPGGNSGGNFQGPYGGDLYGGQGGGGIPLDPINTLFLPRKRFNYDYIGTSLYTRLITFWALEKTLINATMTSARRRSRSILHVKTGIDDRWEPTAQEMDNIAGMFLQADEDPVGAVVVTRTGVDSEEIRSGQDFYKWSDEWELLSQGKLQALGANDALLCLSGDTLVSTKEHGIIRIDTFGKKAVSERLTTVGKEGSDTTRRWLYSGHGQVLELQTYSGNRIRCTPNHQVLVLVNNDLVWKKARDLEENDYLCIAKEKCTRQTPLVLDLTTQPKGKMAHGLIENVVKPKLMTPDLAYVLGILVSEGCIDNYRLRVSNTELNILEGVKEKLLHIFGNSVDITIKEVKQVDRVDKHGVEWKSTKQSYELCCWSKIIANYLNQLGIKLANGNSAKEKDIPWSILQADEFSQISYLAAYVDGDGCVKRNGKELIIYSYSKAILHQTQVMLNSHGIDSVVRDKSVFMPCGNAYELCKKLAEYSCSNKFNDLMKPENPDRFSEYNKLINLFEKKYKFTQLKSIKEIDDEVDVYDIQMTQDPSFVANGLIVHNSGDATYSNQENARMFFMERALGLRDTITAKLFHNRLFPLLARIHGFRKRTTAQLNHKIRIENSETGYNVRADESDSGKLTQRQALDIPESELILPEISWKKELVSDIDEAKLDVYERLEEKGVPIHLRDWSTAGNIDLDAQMSGLSVDADLRKQVNSWKANSGMTETDTEEEEARLQFIQSLKGLAHSNVKASLGSETKELGPLSSWVFWGKEAALGPLKAMDLAAFIKTIRPDDNSCRVLLDGNALRHKLHSHFHNETKAEIAHYLMYRSGFTRWKPGLGKDAVDILSRQIKSSLDQHGANGNVYQLGKLAESELRLIGSLTRTQKYPAEKFIGESTKKLDKDAQVKVENLGRGFDKISNDSPNLYSGVS